MESDVDFKSLWEIRFGNQQLSWEEHEQLSADATSEVNLNSICVKIKKLRDVLQKRKGATF